MVTKSNGLLCHHLRKMDLLLHTRNQRPVKTTRENTLKKVEFQKNTIFEPEKSAVPRYLIPKVEIYLFRIQRCSVKRFSFHITHQLLQSS